MPKCWPPARWSRPARLQNKRLPAGSEVLKAIVAGAGAAGGIAVMVGYASATGTLLWMVPFATSIILVMAAPDSPQAQPRNVIGGHVVSAIAGFVVLALAGQGSWQAVPAVGLAVFAMVLTRTLHPPAGINGVIVATAAPPIAFVLVPVLSGACLLTALAIVYHRSTRPGSWPLWWWTPPVPAMPDISGHAASKKAPANVGNPP